YSSVVSAAATSPVSFRVFGASFFCSASPPGRPFGVASKTAATEARTAQDRANRPAFFILHLPPSHGSGIPARAVRPPYPPPTRPPEPPTIRRLRANRW